MKREEVHFGYGLKSTLAQCWALTTTYFFNIQQGFNVMMPTVIIGAMRLGGKDTLPGITDDQLSWVGSLVYLSPPLGSLALTLVQGRLGHRVCMALTDLVQFLSVFIVVLFPITVSSLYLCSILMGLSTGLATGLCISYSGEVCEPKLRGVLTSALNVFYFAGYFFVTTAYAITDSWKMTMLITVAVPTFNLLAVFATPDSPIWLLSKGHTNRARKILMKLRGGATEETCALEFHEMVQYVAQSTKPGREPMRKLLSNSNFSHPGLWKPLKLMIIYIFFSNIMSGVPYMPDLVDVFHTFNTPISPAWATSIYTAFSVIGNIFTIVLVGRQGKRSLVLWTTTVCSLSYLFIGMIGLFRVETELAYWTKTALFFASTFSSSLGIMPLGWIFMGEVFPMKSKNLGCNVGNAVYFLLSFIMARYYKDLEKAVGFHETFMLFGCSGLGSLAYFYLSLPETENKTLKEIAEHFDKKTVIVRRPVKLQETVLAVETGGTRNV